MGVVILIKFLVKFFIDVLAWPLIALGYPLCASIRAIETNSKTEMQKLITYWILLDLIYLFDLAFEPLIHWIPFWSHIKLMAVCWLVLPQFDGAYNVYEHLFRPCFSLQLQVLTNLFSKPNVALSPKPETFLAMAERYVQENGSEELQKLISSKFQSKGAKPCVDVEQIKSVASTEKAMAGPVESKFKEVVQKDINEVELKEKNSAASANSVKFAEPKYSQAEKRTVTLMETKEKKAAPELEAEPKCAQVEKKIVDLVETKEKKAAPELAAEPKHAQAEKKTVDYSVDTKEKNAAPATILPEASPKPNEKKTVPPPVETREKKESPPEVDGAGDLKNVQKEWTCTLCQVTTTSEGNLNGHFQGRKHKLIYEELRAQQKHSNKNKGPSSSSSSTPEPKNQVPRYTTNPNKPAKKDDRAAQWKQNLSANAKPYTKQVGKQSFGPGGPTPSKLWCGICNLSCPGQIDMASHLVGKKHLARVQEILESFKVPHA